MVSINIYGASGQLPAEPPPLPIGALVAATYDLLLDASDLPQPADIGVYDSQSVMLQFPPVPASLTAVARWGMRFGGLLSSELHEDCNGGAKVRCRVEFDYFGIEVLGFTHVPAELFPDGI
jgi:hypothetical protein